MTRKSFDERVVRIYLVLAALSFVWFACDLVGLRLFPITDTDREMHLFSGCAFLVFVSINRREREVEALLACALSVLLWRGQVDSLWPRWILGLGYVFVCNMLAYVISDLALSLDLLQALAADLQRNNLKSNVLALCLIVSVDSAIPVGMLTGSIFWTIFVCGTLLALSLGGLLVLCAPASIEYEP